VPFDSLVKVSHAANQEDTPAGDAVLAVMAALDAPDGRARVCLPAPHPGVRLLFAAGWRQEDSDLFMASDPGLLSPRRGVPNPGGAQPGRRLTWAAPDPAGAGVPVIQATAARPAGMTRLVP
jgi:hypothetical protein